VTAKKAWAGIGKAIFFRCRKSTFEVTEIVGIEQNA